MNRSLVDNRTATGRNVSVSHTQNMTVGPTFAIGITCLNIVWKDIFLWISALRNHLTAVDGPMMSNAIKPLHFTFTPNQVWEDILHPGTGMFPQGSHELWTKEHPETSFHSLHQRTSHEGSWQDLQPTSPCTSPTSQPEKERTPPKETNFIRVRLKMEQCQRIATQILLWHIYSCIYLSLYNI